MSDDVRNARRILLAASTFEGMTTNGPEVDLRFRCRKGGETWVDVRIDATDLAELVRRGQTVLRAVQT
jgi:hypothetical protein